MLLSCVERWICALFCIPVVGIGWLLLAAASVNAALHPATTHTLLGLPLPDNARAVWLLAALLALRGALALLATARYRHWFRVDVISATGDKRVRALWLFVCTAAWLSLAHWTKITLPDWLITWGVVAWCWLLLPFIQWGETADNDPGVVNDSLHEMDNPINPSDPLSVCSFDDVNPATGLLMSSDGAVDIAGNLYGTSSSSMFDWPND